MKIYSWYLRICLIVLFGSLSGCNSGKKDYTDVDFILPMGQLKEYELDIDHKGLISNLDNKTKTTGAKIYNSNCINCHGSIEAEGTLPTASKFWTGEFKVGSDPFSMYQVVTRGFQTMPPQVLLTPKEKYSVIQYIREEFVKKYNRDQFVEVDLAYIKDLPIGSAKGPNSDGNKPWEVMNYGDFLINTYELADSSTPDRNMSNIGNPLPDEDFSKSNFAYKGIAVRLDKGYGGVAKGKHWMVFDHDLLRVAGGWYGEGFIDWKGILLNGSHNISPRTVGDLLFNNPVLPGFANPKSDTFDDPRFTARDGRKFGPLPKDWGRLKGIYHYNDNVVISYYVGDAQILELMSMEMVDDQPVYVRNIHVTNTFNHDLKLHIASDNVSLTVKGDGVLMQKVDGQHYVQIESSQPRIFKIYIANRDIDLNQRVDELSLPQKLLKFTKGGELRYPEIYTTKIVTTQDQGAFEVQKLTAPVDNKWNSRLQITGIDFFANDPDKGVVSCVGGDVWLLEGLLNNDVVKWRRIASGLFQPLGIKVLEEEIYVICRDQLVKLVDLNGNGEIDYYQSFNNDHQVTDHFHEFAMGLQTDQDGNFYYAKSARHAREALVPQHGTLLKISKNGDTTEILANGFRAANGVCINPDGSFMVTDQEGHWNPMNRINWIDVNNKKGFYGNMYGYNPPKDSTNIAMIPPLAWVDKKLDRSPSELLWVDSDKWGPLKGSLLNLSYGYGTILLVPHSKINGQLQGGLVKLPIGPFETGVMRGRFHPTDGKLYACGMAAWGTQRSTLQGGLYRVAYTGKSVFVPLEVNVTNKSIFLEFSDELKKSSIKPENFKIKTWELQRSRNYGSKRYNEKSLTITDANLNLNDKSVVLKVNGLEPVWQMEISYDIKGAKDEEVKNKIQYTVHNLSAPETVLSK